MNRNLRLKEGGESIKKAIMSFFFVSLLVCASLTGIFILISEDEKEVSAKTITVPNDHSTIQEAVDAANPGDTVFVKSGTYYENVGVDKMINLTGEDRDTTIIDGGGSGDVVNVNANWVNVTGFTMRNGGSEEWPNYDAGIDIRSDYNKISNNNISNNNKYGIYLDSRSRNNIIGNIISSNGRDGIFFVDSTRNNIIGNTISSHDEVGLWFMRSHINNIIGNNFSLNNLSGIYLWNSWQNNIDGNYVTNNYYYGIYLVVWSVNNSIINNTVSSNGQNGIDFLGSPWNNITHNNISNNKGAGIILEPDVGPLPSSNNNLIDNIISSNGYGIYLELSANNIMIKNTVRLNDNYGFYLTTSTDNSIYHNNIINNVNQAFDDVDNNYWNDTYPPGGNYWSDFDEPSEGAYDDYQEEDQNVEGSDGIVDGGLAAGGGINPYTIDADSQDNYPLMEPIKRSIQPLPPPILYINVSQDGKDIILYWDPPPAQDFDPYLIYRSTDPTNFDFNTVWVNTLTDKEPGESEPIPERTMWNDTNAAFPGNDTNYEEQYYYIIRAFNDRGEVSRTSRTVGKWTKTFSQEVSTFSLPLEPINTLYTHNLTASMNADYIKYMDTTTHVWVKHDFEDGNKDNIQMRLGEGYEVRLGSQTNYTFTGMPGAMISYDDDSGFTGFDWCSEAKSLSVFIQPNGDVKLNWQEPGSMGPGDWYEVYYSNTRDGFFGIFNLDYFLVDSVNFGTNTATHIGALANDPGARLYYLVVPFNANSVRGTSTYSIGIWTEEYLPQYDTFGIPLKLSSYQTADWYCDNIPNTVGINHFNVSSQRWRWHSTRMPKGAYDPMLIMTEGYQISTSNTPKFTFVGR